MRAIRRIFKRKGFWEIYDALSESERISLAILYDNIDYYNSFHRIKNLLLDHDLISIEGEGDKRGLGNKRDIVVTEKGRKFFKKLKAMEGMLDE